MTDSKSATALPATASDGLLALIGGSSFLKSQHLQSFQKAIVSTKFGNVLVHRGTGKYQKVVFVQRHEANPNESYSPPHLVNKRAIIAALHQLKCSSIIAFGSVGTLKPSVLQPGVLILPNDIFNIYENITFFDHSRQGHKVPAFSDKLREEVMAALKANSIPFVREGVYSQTIGPRFESMAEIRFLAMVADVVGMTCAHEAILAQELELPYALVCMVDNIANGLQAQEKLSLEQFERGVHQNLKTMENVLDILLHRFMPPVIEQPAVAGKAAPIAVDLVVHARYVVPVEDGMPSVMDHHSIVVSQGKIVAIVPHAVAETHYTAAEVHDVRHTHCLMPGLVNAHTHVGMTLLRGFADDQLLMTWLSQHIWPAEFTHCSPDFVKDGSDLAMAEMIRGGTTMFNDMYFFPETTAECAVKAGLRATIGICIIEFPSNYAKNPEDYLEKGLATATRFKNEPLLRFSMAPHAPYTVSDANFTVVRDLAAKHGMQIHCHVHETADEVEHSSAGNKAAMGCHKSDHNIPPLDNLDRLGMVSPSLIAVHMTQLTPEHVQLMGKRGAHVAHCPSSNLKLASGFCPVADLAKAGVNVALGTDSAASNNSLDMMAELKTAAIVAKAVAKDPTAMHAKEAIRMATINGAKALGVQNETGSLKVGKSADIVAIDFSVLELQPVYDVVSHLVYSAGSSDVTDVWVRGQRLLRHRKLMTIDESELKHRIKRWNSVLLKHKLDAMQMSSNAST